MTGLRQARLGALILFLFVSAVAGSWCQCSDGSSGTKMDNACYSADGTMCMAPAGKEYHAAYYNGPWAIAEDFDKELEPQETTTDEPDQFSVGTSASGPLGFIENRLTPGKCIDVPDGWPISKSPKLSIHDCERDRAPEDTDQMWILRFDEFIENRKYPGRCIDTEGNPATWEGAKLQLHPCEFDWKVSDQRWYLRSDGYIESRLNTGFCIDVKGTKNGAQDAPLQLAPCNDAADMDGNTDQQWNIIAGAPKTTSTQPSVSVDATESPTESPTMALTLMPTAEMTEPAVPSGVNCKLTPATVNPGNPANDCKCRDPDDPDSDATALCATQADLSCGAVSPSDAATSWGACDFACCDSDDDFDIVVPTGLPPVANDLTTPPPASGCNSVLGAVLPDGKTCGAHIAWLQHQGYSRTDAEEKVGAESPAVCGACAKVTTTPAPTPEGIVIPSGDDDFEIIFPVPPNVANDLPTPICSNINGGKSSTYPCKCGLTIAAIKRCTADLPLCTATTDDDGACQIPTPPPTENPLNVCSVVDGQDLSTSYPCNCGDEICQEGEMCTEATSSCVVPVECSVIDGSALSTEYPCSCGVRICRSDDYCNRNVAGGVCQYVPCSVIDGSALSSAYPCTCGNSQCSTGEFCFAAEDKCSIPNGEQCSVQDATALSSTYPCNCGDQTCESGTLCDAANNVCKPLEQCSITDNSGLSYAYPCECGAGVVCSTGTTCDLASTVCNVPPAACSVDDGTAVSASYPCSCGDAICSDPLTLCIAANNQCVTPNSCSVYDGSRLSEGYPCSCGDAICTAAQVCNSATSSCVDPGACSIIDGTALSSTYPCMCGTDNACSSGEICDSSLPSCLQPASCDVSDGSGPSSFYPCGCGGSPPADFCEDGKWCTSSPTVPGEYCIVAPEPVTTTQSDIKECTATDGLSASAKYPCKCGPTSVCPLGSFCNAADGTCTDVVECSTSTNHVDGIDLSSTYPCLCGDQVCLTGQMCNRLIGQCEIPSADECPPFATPVCSDGYQFVDKGVDENGCKLGGTCEPVPTSSKPPLGACTCNDGTPGGIGSGGFCFKDGQHCDGKAPCTEVNGSGPSDTYPCICGSIECQHSWEICSAGQCVSPDPCTVTDNSLLSATYPCRCGETVCVTDELCDSTPSICSPVPGDCTVTDGSAISAKYPCTCVNQDVCTMELSYCNAGKCENPTPCSIIDGSAASQAYPCSCGTETCTLGQVCTATEGVGGTGICRFPEKELVTAVTTTPGLMPGACTCADGTPGGLGSNGKCNKGGEVCEAGPCTGKAEGDSCKLCFRGEAGCMETTELKTCRSGRCLPTPEALPTPAPPAAGACTCADGTPGGLGSNGKCNKGGEVCEALPTPAPPAPPTPPPVVSHFWLEMANLPYGSITKEDKAQLEKGLAKIVADTLDVPVNDIEDMFGKVGNVSLTGQDDSWELTPAEEQQLKSHPEAAQSVRNNVGLTGNAKYGHNPRGQSPNGTIMNFRVVRGMLGLPKVREEWYNGCVRVNCKTSMSETVTNAMKKDTTLDVHGPLIWDENKFFPSGGFGGLSISTQRDMEFTTTSAPAGSSWPWWWWLLLLLLCCLIGCVIVALMMFCGDNVKITKRDAIPIESDDDVAVTEMSSDVEEQSPAPPVSKNSPLAAPPLVYAPPTPQVAYVAATPVSTPITTTPVATYEARSPPVMAPPVVTEPVPTAAPVKAAPVQTAPSVVVSETVAPPVQTGMPTPVYAGAPQATRADSFMAMPALAAAPAPAAAPVPTATFGTAAAYGVASQQVAVGTLPQATEYVVYQGIQIPFYTETILRTWTFAQLQEYALLLQARIGFQVIGEAIPHTQTGLIIWILMVQTRFLIMLRQAAALFDSIDTNHDGFITRQEMAQAAGR